MSVDFFSCGTEMDGEVSLVEGGMNVQDECELSDTDRSM